MFDELSMTQFFTPSFPNWKDAFSINVWRKPNHGPTMVYFGCLVLSEVCYVEKLIKKWVRLCSVGCTTNLTAWRDRGVIQNSSSKKKPKFPRKDEFRHRVATKLIKNKYLISTCQTSAAWISSPCLVKVPKSKVEKESSRKYLAAWRRYLIGTCNWGK